MHPPFDLLTQPIEQRIEICWPCDIRFKTQAKTPAKQMLCLQLTFWRALMRCFKPSVKTYFGSCQALRQIFS